MRRLAILSVFAIPGLLACQGPPPGVPMSEAAASISEEDYLRKVEVIAHDSMLGRANPSPGLDMTAQWVADEFRSYGLEPGGDQGSYVQNFTMRREGLDFERSSARVSGGETLAFGTDLSFMRTPGVVDLTAGAVVVAGEPGPEETMDAGALTGKHVLVVLPSGVEGRRRYRYIAGLTDAEPASFVIVDSSSDEEWDASVARAREQYRRIAPWQEGGADGPAFLTIRENSLAPILAARGMELEALRAASDFTMRAVPDLEISLHTETVDAGSYTLPNTVGILEGSDPELRDEYIVFSAHMDHVGVGRPNEEGDSIRNGADDDASGTIAVVELAEAFSMLDEGPRRSMIFLGVGGEEVGLLGSRHFVESPPVPLTGMVANLNADMISRNSPDSIVVIGKEHSDLGTTLNRVAEEHPELDLTAADDIWPEENFYRRSDHFNFARRGVPVLFFFCGTHEDYHQPSDEVARMDISKASRVTRLMFYMGLELANADEAPRWDPESRAEIVDMGG